MSKKRKEIHGNNAKANPEHKPASLYIANTVTMADKEEHGTPLVPDSNVAYAKKFVEVNEK